MIDLDAIEKECQQMIADGLGFLSPKSCGNAEMVAELVAELRNAKKDSSRYLWLRDDATDYHTGEIHGAQEEDRDDLVDMFMWQLRDRMKQIHRAKSKMINHKAGEVKKCGR